jgi:shikimate kinase
LRYFLAMAERGNNIVLVGFMGSGKSSIGRRLEKRTKFPRFDTDEMVAAKFRLSIPRIFEIHGEDVFRAAESETLHALDPRQMSIIVTGGGIVLRTTHRELLRELGLVVYLQANEEELFARISNRSLRPLLRSDDPRATMRGLLQKRLPLYEEIADLTVDTAHLRPGEVCDEILKTFRGKKKLKDEYSCSRPALSGRREDRARR